LHTQGLGVLKRMVQMKQKELEMAIQSILPHPSPRPELEQYPTPAPIAAQILYLAYSCGDIEGKKVLDLGCGTGVFAIGAALLGAREVIGIDIDEVALGIAKKASAEKGLDVEFICSDIEDVKLSADTVLQNPPFGAQKKKADRPFLEKALSCASVAYTLHSSETQEFIESFAQQRRWNITHTRNIIFRIGHMFRFHQKEQVQIDVTLYRIER